MSQLILDVPDESLLSLHLSDEAAAAEIRLAAAVKLYELGRLSSGAAARLAGIPRVLFLSKLADYGVDPLPEIVCNTSPLQYLYQIGQLDLLPQLTGQIIVPTAVTVELAEGRRRGVDVPVPEIICGAADG
jgi:predicted HTH domain antitoxin